MAELKYFFSHSRKDSAFVLKLAKELREAGANLWLDQLDIRGGEPWDIAVEKALHTCQGVIAVLSPASVSSDDVRDEIYFALDKEKPVIPVIIESCEVPLRLHRLQRVDFTASYETGFSRLLKALQIEQPRSPEPEKESPEIEKGTPPVLTDTSRPTWRERFVGVLIWFDIFDLRNVYFSLIGCFQTRRQKLIGALIWLGIGSVFIFLENSLRSLWNLPEDSIVIALIWIFPGAICGTDKQVIKAAVICCLVGCLAGISYAILQPEPTLIYNPKTYLNNRIVDVCMTAYLGAVGGAIVGVFLKKRRSAA